MALTYMTNGANGLNMVMAGGSWRQMGCLPPDPEVMRTAKLFSSTYPIIPRSEWKECTLRDWPTKVLNQGPYGACVGYGTVAAFEYIWQISGQKPHNFSPTFIYGLINGGVDKGAQVSNGLKALMKSGTCLIDQVPANMIYQNQFSEEAYKVAERFKGQEAFLVNSYDAIGSALMQGFPVVSGIAVGKNVYNPVNGVIPLPDQIIGGHCLPHIGLKRVNGQWMLETRNSWSASYGLGGYCYVQEGAFNPAYKFGFDAWALVGVVDDPADVTDDPPIMLVSTELKEAAKEIEEEPLFAEVVSGVIATPAIPPKSKKKRK